MVATCSAGSNNVLDISKIETGMASVNLSDVAVGELLAECEMVPRGLPETAGLSFKLDTTAPHPSYISVDRIKVKQILLNLLANAVKFTQPGGEVMLSVRGDASWIEIEVRDTGIGMSSNEIAVALRPFRQVDESHTRKYQGAGLGLSIVRGWWRSMAASS